MNNKDKGKRVERNIVNWMKERGVDSAQRSVQYCGRNGDSDVIAPQDLPSFHIEVKGTKDKKLNKSTLLKWANQLKTDNKTGKIAVLFHVANGEAPVAFTTLAMFTPLSKTMKPELFTFDGVVGDSLIPSDIVKKFMLERRLRIYMTGIERVEYLPFLAFAVDNDTVFLATDGELFLKEMRYFERVCADEQCSTTPFKSDL